MLPKPIYLKVFQPNHSASSIITNGLFLRDPQADLYLDLNQNIFPIHRNYFLQSETISKFPVSEKFLFIDTECNFNITMFVEILSLFYGINLKLKTYLELQKALQIIDFLGIKELKESIERQIYDKIFLFDLFHILNIAFLFGFKKIYDYCFEGLRKEQFEQILYEKYDLVSCDFKLFQIVLRVHQVLKQKSQIVGLDIQIIEQIIALYCQIHYYDCETKMKLLEKYGQQKKVIPTDYQSTEKYEEKSLGKFSLKLERVTSQLFQHSEDEETETTLDSKQHKQEQIQKQSQNLTPEPLPKPLRSSTRKIVKLNKRIKDRIKKKILRKKNQNEINTKNPIRNRTKGDLGSKQKYRVTNLGQHPLLRMMDGKTLKMLKLFQLCPLKTKKMKEKSSQAIIRLQQLKTTQRIWLEKFHHYWMNTKMLIRHMIAASKKCIKNQVKNCQFLMKKMEHGVQGLRASVKQKHYSPILTNGQNTTQYSGFI